LYQEHLKNYQNLIIGFQVTVKNVGCFFETQCTTKGKVNGNVQHRFNLMSTPALSRYSCCCTVLP